MPSDVGALLPTGLPWSGRGLAGPLPPSVGDLGPLLQSLQLANNAIASLPTEIGALTSLENLDLEANALTAVPSEIADLTGLTELHLDENKLTGVPADFQTVDPSTACFLGQDDPSFSCANVGFGTSCCTVANCGDTSTCSTE